MTHRRYSSCFIADGRRGQSRERRHQMLHPVHARGATVVQSVVRPLPGTYARFRQVSLGGRHLLPVTEAALVRLCRGNSNNFKFRATLHHPPIRFSRPRIRTVIEKKTKERRGMNFLLDRCSRSKWKVARNSCPLFAWAAWRVVAASLYVVVAVLNLGTGPAWSLAQCTATTSSLLCPVAPRDSR